MIEKRKVNLIVAKAGGNASKNAYNCKISIPKLWADIMGAGPDSREMIMEFDGEKIILKKA